LGCPRSETVCCGSRRETLQDCLELRWLIFDKMAQTIYQSTEVVSASGTLEVTSTTTLMTNVNVEFSVGSIRVMSFNLGNKQGKAFTVLGFDTITLTGNSVSPTESAAGTLCLTPRYQLV
jgi:hypothetical protein